MRTWVAHRRVVAGCAATVLLVAACLVLAPPERPIGVVLGIAAVAALAYASLAPTPPERSRLDPVETIGHELERSRRHGHSCSLARLPGAALDACGHLRRADAVWAVGGDLMLLMPETSGPGARLAVQRLVGENLAERAVVATFPDDALTVHRLLESLRSPRPAAAPEAVVPAPALAVVNLEVPAEAR